MNTKQMSRAGLVFLMAMIELAISSVLCRAQNASEADSLGKFTLSGTVDAYYHRSFTTAEQAPATSFSNLPGFSLGMVNVVAECRGTKTGFLADLVFGPRGSDAIFNSPLYKNASGAGSAHLINQMFVYYAMSENIKLNAGQFNTFIGYEAISPAKNIQYSTSYLFSYGPFNHTGVWADVKLSNAVSAKLAWMNPTDYTEYNPFDSYTLGGQLSVTGAKATINLSATYGDPDGELQASDSVGTTSAGNALQVDMTATYRTGEKYTLALSSSVRSIGSGQIKISADDHTYMDRCGYYGVALYQSVSINPTTLLGVRTEYFLEFNQGVGAIGKYNTAGDAHVMSLTLCGNVSVGNLRFIPEIRLDRTSSNAFTDLETGAPINQMISLNAAVVYAIPVIVRKFRQ